MLTKELIKKEGWKYWKEGPSADGPSFTSNNFVCQLLIPNNILEEMADIKANLVVYKTGILSSDKIPYKNSTLFLGECKDVNTFSYLCELLKINNLVD